MPQHPKPMDSPASEWASSLLTHLIRGGVRDIVVCPGSRSQALALAAAAAEHAGAIRLHVRVDERSAAFFALGIARESGMPAPVIVTSGTAVANLIPAALEAHEGRVPLLLLSGDRPEELRGVRSSQTTQQHSLLRSFARLVHDAPAPEPEAPAAALTHAAAALAADALRHALGAAGGAPAGPVHLNLAFREPLSGPIAAGDDGAAAFTEAARQRDAVGAEVVADTTHDTPSATHYTHRGDTLAVVVAGSGAGEAAEAFARAAGLPLLAEVGSGARFGREAIAHYAELLDRHDVGGLIEQVIVFGHPTLTRQVPALIRRPDVRTVVIDAHTGTDHYAPHPAVRVAQSASVAADHEPQVLRRWLGLWVREDRELLTADDAALGHAARTLKDADFRELSAYTRHEIAQQRARVTREALVSSVWRATWPYDRLVLAASRLIRVLDRLATPRRITVHANRGLAGIDGTVATALGISAAAHPAHADERAAAGVTRLLIGDVAMLHDVGSLLRVAEEPTARVLVIVGNDHGGTIFDTLEAAATASPQGFDRVMRTPQRVDLAALAQAYGWHYRCAETQGDLDAALAAPVTGPTLVEVPLER